MCVCSNFPEYRRNKIVNDKVSWRHVHVYVVRVNLRVCLYACVIKLADVYKTTWQQVRVCVVGMSVWE